MANDHDQHAVCSFHGLPVAPVSLATTPVPLRKPRARHDLNPAGPHPRRASVCERGAASSSGCASLDASLVSGKGATALTRGGPTKGGLFGGADGGQAASLA
jgi:hypothetical protein